MAATANIRQRIKGRSKNLLDAIRRLERAARVPKVAILITGETGTGKELAARLVHEKSGRTGAFVAFNCATVPKDLMDSELFGYVRSAFSGAYRDHPGLFEQAEGGTLFLDEIGEMPPEMQAKVLRAIQEGEVRRVGDTRVRKVDVRIVTATHCDLQAMVEAGQFREDLLYRLKGYVVSLPPLRERGRDIVLLARDFLRDTFPSKRISLEAEAVLLRYDWPGNVRELQNVIRSAGIDAGRTVLPRHLVDIDGAEDKTAASSRTDIILGVIDRLGNAAPFDIRVETSLTRTTLLRALNDLVAAGVLKRTGEGRDTRYTRAEVQQQQTEDALTARQRLILRHAEDAGRITRQQAAEASGAAIRTASRDLSRLVELGRLVPDGKTGNAAGYVLP
ncbi:MAG: sigma 54-interacting transcriptional regulator [Acidobacteriota bacterium]